MVSWSSIDDSTLGEDARLQPLLIIREALMHNPHDAAAWFQLASLIGDPEREKFCLEQVLIIDPQHAGARERLAAILSGRTESEPTAEPVQTWREARCPYVGLLGDPQTLTAYASSLNHCYRLKEPKSIKLEYQQHYCLTPAHKRCLVFQRGEKAAPQPSKEKSPLQPAPGKPAVNRSTS
mgnify:CR=1 FL=1